MKKPKRFYFYDGEIEAWYGSAFSADVISEVVLPKPDRTLNPKALPKVQSKLKVGTILDLVLLNSMPLKKCQKLSLTQNPVPKQFQDASYLRTRRNPKLVFRFRGRRVWINRKCLRQLKKETTL